jgi:3-oxoacyl-[acyl-carrier protein] reductase
MDLGLRGKVAAVAAASKGLGRAVATLFAEEGARVAICSREGEVIDRVAREISAATKGEVIGIAADVSTAEGCESFIRAARDRFGRLDILVSNAGGPPPGRFDDLDDAKWQRAVELTLFSAIRLTREALPHFRAAGGGSVVFMTSTSVRQPTQYLNLILSNAIRAAVQGMAKTLSSDLAKDGVRVNCVQPGRIFTERIEQLDSDTAKRQNTTPEAIRAHYEKTVIPMGRYGKPEEFAAAVVFLASPRASYITGTSLQVDGGMLMSMF